MKPEYGPTLGRLLAPRWHAASRLTRWVLVLVCVGLLAALLAAGLTLSNSTFSRGGSVPFSFSYRDLYRTAADPGGYVKVQRRHSDGALADSFAVAPLRLAPYSGELTGELPLYASSYIRELSRRHRGFVLGGEGKSTVNGVAAYNVYFTALVEGHRLFGRDVLLLPERAGAREGVVISMLTTRTNGAKLVSPTEVAAKGVLALPLKSFTIG
jgi:hypothetical protein